MVTNMRAESLSHTIITQQVNTSIQIHQINGALRTTLVFAQNLCNAPQHIWWSAYVPGIGAALPPAQSFD